MLALSAATRRGEDVDSDSDMAVFGASMDLASQKVSARPQEMNEASVRSLKTKDCPCKCTSRNKAKGQCKPFGNFCSVSSCNFPNGKKGSRCCDNAVGNFGRCECRSGIITLAWSFVNEGEARNKAADACAERKSCPPNCNCGRCPVGNVFCLKGVLPKKAGNFWVCRVDCTSAVVTTCERIPGTR